MEDIIPFGFIEVETAKHFNMDYYDMGTSEGLVAMVGRDDFMLVSARNDGFVAQSDIDGMHISVHPYYKNFLILDALTSGETKATQAYISASEKSSELSSPVGVKLTVEEIPEVGLPEEDAEVVVGVDFGETVTEEPEEVDDLAEKVSNLSNVFSFNSEYHNGHVVISGISIMSNHPTLKRCVDLVDQSVIVTSSNATLLAAKNEFGDSAIYLRVDRMGQNSYALVNGERVGIKVPYDYLEATPSVEFCTLENGIYFTSSNKPEVALEQKLLGNSVKIESGADFIGLFFTNNVQTSGGYSSIYEYRFLSEALNKNIVNGALELKNIPDTIVVRSGAGWNRQIPGNLFGSSVSTVAAPSDITDQDLIIRDTVSNIICCTVKGNVFTMYNYNDGMAEAVAYRLTGDRTYAELRKFDEVYYTDVRKKGLNNYKDTFVSSYLKSFDNKKHRIAALEGDYKELNDSIMRISKEIRDLTFEVKNFDVEKAKEEISERAVVEFEELLNIEKVSFIDIRDDYLYVFTHNIYVKHDITEKWYDIGTFIIRVYIGASSYNTDHTMIWNTKFNVHGYEEGMNAPHVFSTGSLCHGNLTAGISGSYRDGDMYGVIFQLIMFLSSANQDDIAGQKLDRWPEVSEDEAMAGLNDGKHVYKKPESSEMDELLQNALNVI